MNRKNLTAAVLAGLAGAAGIVGSAQAVNIDPDGLGQVLIYPYYTTNGGNVTLLSVVNTTDEAKAVKVRFKEGKNSREVLDFNLYMSAWTSGPLPFMMLRQHVHLLQRLLVILLQPWKLVIPHVRYLISMVIMMAPLHFFPGE